MSLYDRLGVEHPGRIPVHTFHAALGELERGQATQAQLVAAWGLDAGEEAELATLVGRIVVPEEMVTFGGFTVLTNVGTSYDATTASQGLGWAGVQTAGIVQLTFAVRVNKIGTGTQSWQLWNETDGTEVGVIDDAGGAGIKLLSTTITPPSPLGAGFKVVRVRVKSTTGNDDPVYLGGALRLRRSSRLTSQELHEILLLREDGVAYLSLSALQARLGV